MADWETARAGTLAKRLQDDGITAMKGDPTVPLALTSDGQYRHAKDLDRMLRPIRKIRDAAGMEMQIADDGHGKWMLPVTIRIAQAVEPYEMMWQEDPQRQGIGTRLKPEERDRPHETVVVSDEARESPIDALGARRSAQCGDGGGAGMAAARARPFPRVMRGRDG